MTGVDRSIYCSLVNIVLGLIGLIGFLSVIGLYVIGYWVSVTVNMGVCVLVSIAYMIVNKNMGQLCCVEGIFHVIVSACYGFSWAHQLYYSLDEERIEIVILSYISILFSISAILLCPVR